MGMPYPTEAQAIASLPDLLGFFTGGDKSVAYNGAWTVAGYGLSFISPLPTPPLKLGAAHETAVKAGIANPGAINWQQLLQIALAILAQFFPGA